MYYWTFESLLTSLVADITFQFVNDFLLTIKGRRNNVFEN